jgi:hypothetical protein
MCGIRLKAFPVLLFLSAKQMPVLAKHAVTRQQWARFQDGQNDPLQAVFSSFLNTVAKVQKYVVL